MAGSPAHTIPRLDARYDWLGWNYNPSRVFGSASVPLRFSGDGCSNAEHTSMAGTLALVLNTAKCTYYDQVRVAQHANASGLVVAAAAGAVLLDMNCEGAECDDTSLAIPATMITHEDGEAIRQALGRGDDVNMSFSTVQANGTDFLIDADGHVRQSWGGSGLGSGHVDGNPGDSSAKLFPRMSFLAWSARFELYRRTLGTKLNSAAHTVKIFDSQPIRPHSGNCYGAEPYGCGPWAVVAVPKMRAGTRWELDLALGCNGTSDVACPQWDHVVQARACVVPPGANTSTCDAQAGPEIGRWVTSFGRRVGHWLLDVTPIASLVASTTHVQRVNVTIHTAPWAGNQGAIPWLATLALRVTDDPLSAAGARVLQPWAGLTTETGGISSVLRWIAFNQSYNSFFSKPFRFEVDAADADAVRLYAVITGHGNDNHGCGEFCATEHRFSIDGGVTVTKRQMLPVSNQQVGCAEEVDTGVTPNEYGTWLYGRDGWCNGRPVLPWVADISAHVRDLLGNRTAVNVSLEYSAVWCSAPGVCHAPDPGPPSTWQQALPVMMVALYVVVGTAPAAPWSWEKWAAVSVGGGVAALVLGAASFSGSRRTLRALRERRLRLMRQVSFDATASLLASRG